MEPSEIFLSQDSRRVAEIVTELGTIAHRNGWPLAALICVKETDESVVYVGETHIQPEMYAILSRNPQQGAGLFHAAGMIAGGIAAALPDELVAVMMAGPGGETAGEAAGEAPVAGAPVASTHPGAASEGVASQSEEAAPVPVAPVAPTPEGEVG